MHNSDEQKTNQNKNIQTVRLVPDITKVNFFKSVSFKSGEKQEIYTNNGKKNPKTSRRLAETEPTARSRNRKARMKCPSGLFHVECYVAIWVGFFVFVEI